MASLHSDIKKKSWRRADKAQIKNRRLWQTVDDLRSEKYIEVKKVRAHSGVRGNDIADSLAVDAARYDIDGVFINDLFEAKCSV